MTALRIPIVLIAAIASAGCRHYSGWVEKETRVTEKIEKQATAKTNAPATLRVRRVPTADSGVVEARVSLPGPNLRRTIRELVARRTYVKYHWSAPLIKPFLMITLVPPFYMSYTNPHNHDGGNWGRGDYFRDVLAYYNLFEALPGDTLHVEKKWTILRREVGPLRRPQGSLVSGALLAIRVEGETLGSFRTGEDGVGRFDLGAQITEEMAKAGRAVDIVLLWPDAPPQTKTIFVGRETLQALRAAR